jgi:hypothetical protein
MLQCTIKVVRLARVSRLARLREGGIESLGRRSRQLPAPIVDKAA